MSLNPQIPTPNSAPLDDGGRWTRPWYLYLASLGQSASPSADITIGADVVGGTEGNVLFVGPGEVLAQNNYFHFNTAQYRLGIGESNPQNPLHVVGGVRMDGVGHGINLFFGTTSVAASAALIQYVDSEVVGGDGAVLCGLGWTNASWGWTGDGPILNYSSTLGWVSGNIQADVFPDTTISRVAPNHLQTGLVTLKRTNEGWNDLGSGTSFSIDFSIGGTFRINPTNNFTLTFSNLPVAGKSARVVVEVDSAAGYTGTYPSGFIWSGGTEPTWSAAIDLMTIYVSGDGATYFGMQSFVG